MAPVTSEPYLAFSRFWPRIWMGLLLGAVSVSLILLGGWPWTIAVGLLFWFGLIELKKIFAARQMHPSHVITMITGIGLILLAHYGLTMFFMPVLSFGIIAGFIRLLFRNPRARMEDIGATFIAIFYLGFLPMHYILLRQLSPVVVETLSLPGVPWALTIERGALYVLWAVLVIAFTDVGAYFTGKFFGKHLLYPEISPKKTREGAMGGMLCGMAFGLGFVTAGLSLWQSLLLSLILVVGSQLGDLSESQMKRDAGVKDSGTLLQSHGGLLDRFDSYMFCGAIAYYFIYWGVLHKGLAALL